MVEELSQSHLEWKKGSPGQRDQAERREHSLGEKNRQLWKGSPDQKRRGQPAIRGEGSRRERGFTMTEGLAAEGVLRPEGPRADDFLQTRDLLYLLLGDLMT